MRPREELQTIGFSKFAYYFKMIKLEIKPTLETLGYPMERQIMFKIKDLPEVTIANEPLEDCKLRSSIINDQTSD